MLIYDNLVEAPIHLLHQKYLSLTRRVNARKNERYKVYNQRHLTKTKFDYSVRLKTMEGKVEGFSLSTNTKNTSNWRDIYR